MSKNFDKLLHFLLELPIRFTVLAFSETWATDINYDQFNIPGYKCLSRPREDKTGGGVSLYIQDHILFKDRSDLSDYVSNDCESAFIELNDVFDCKIIVGVVYRPPGNDLAAFNSSFNNLQTKLSFLKCKCFIAGDFNVNLLNWGNHQETEQFLNNALSNSSYPVITLPTRFCDTNSTLIDNIFINNIIEDYVSCILLLQDISDHLPIFYIACNLVNQRPLPKFIVSRHRDFSDESIVRFNNSLSQFDWNTVCVSEDVNVSYNNFINIYETMYNTCFPIKTRRLKIRHQNRKPWITNSILKSIKRKNNLYVKWLKQRSAESLSKYKSYKNKLTVILRNAEKLYYTNRFDDVKNDMSKTWSLIKSTIRHDSVKNNSINALNHDNKIINEPQQIADAFNKYFSNVGPVLASKIPDPGGNFLDFNIPR
jgi:hypothetical protein